MGRLRAFTTYSKFRESTRGISRFWELPSFTRQETAANHGVLLGEAIANESPLGEVCFGRSDLPSGL